jgi:diguanylate cyclase
MSVNAIFIIISLLFGLLTLVVGFSSGVWFAVAPRSKAAAAPPEEDPVQRRNQSMASGLLRIAQSLAGDVQAHSNKVESISTELNAADPNLAESRQLFSGLSSRLLTANLELQQQLSRAKQYIEFQTVQMRARESEARTDRLTSLLNRRAFDEELSRQIAGWDRNETPFVILFLDVDHFKRINDLYGHQIGDNVLRAIAQAVVTELRGMDAAYRYGGEEFAVILPATKGLNACMIAERVRGAVESAQISGSGRPLSVTTSVGVANVIAADAPAQIIARADDALYQAKQAGRNCVRWHDGNAVHSSDARVPSAVKDRPSVPAAKTPNQVSISDFSGQLTRHVCESRRTSTPLSVACLRVSPATNLGGAARKKSQETQLLALVESAKRKLLPSDSFVVISTTELIIVLPGREHAEATHVIDEVLTAGSERSAQDAMTPHFDVCALSPLESAEELFVRVRQDSLATSHSPLFT